MIVSIFDNDDIISLSSSAFDFEISYEDMKLIDQLNKNENVSSVPENTTYLEY